MTVPAIGPVGQPYIAPIPTIGTEGAQGTGGAGFGAALAQGLENLQQLHNTTDTLAVKAATGELTDVHDYMIASAQSGLATQLTMAVRNKALEAFTEIMRLQA